MHADDIEPIQYHLYMHVSFSGHIHAAQWIEIHSMRISFCKARLQVYVYDVLCCFFITIIQQTKQINSMEALGRYRI